MKNRKKCTYLRKMLTICTWSAILIAQRWYIVKHLPAAGTKKEAWDARQSITASECTDRMIPSILTLDK